MNEHTALVLEEIKVGNDLLNQLLKSQSTVLDSISRSGSSSQTKALESTKSHLKKIENTAGLLLEEMRLGRDKSVDEIRQVTRLLARTVVFGSTGAEEQE